MTASAPVRPHHADISPEALRAGFRSGDKGAHGSRTIMLSELTSLLAAVPEGAPADGYRAAIIEENCLGKPTASTRRMSVQRLRELHGLDPRVPLFRALRRAWGADPAGRPLMAMLVALARDPLLRGTSRGVLSLRPGAELVRSEMLAALRVTTADRFNDAVLDKVARNAASSWAQSGHLAGRVRKIRQRVTPTPGAVALACWMGSVEGLGGESLLRSRWAQVLDETGSALEPLVLQARRLGLLQARIGSGVFEIDTRPLLQGGERP